MRQDSSTSLTVAGYDREKNFQRNIIFQIVGGAHRHELNSLNASDSVHDFNRPLGPPPEPGPERSVLWAAAWAAPSPCPLPRLHDQGCVHSVIWLPQWDLLILS